MLNKIFNLFSEDSQDDQAAIDANKLRKNIKDIQPGYRLANKYEVTKILGEGGFGATFLVRSLMTAVPVIYVAKLQKLGEDESRNLDLLERFKKEAQVLQLLGVSHGQIPSLIDFFDFEGNFYLIQEFIQGNTLMDELLKYLKQGYVMADKRAIELMLSLLEVLETVHRQKIIHRDIKPDNIILRQGDGKPVLIDFGIIKDVATSDLGKTGTIIGTPGYCPIEQQVGKTFFQSDLYAVGMTMLFLTTGVPPHKFEITENYELDLTQVEDMISTPLLSWLKEATSVLPQNRFASAEEMREALLHIYNLDYVVQGMALAREENQEELRALHDEIDSLKQELSQSKQQEMKSIKHKTIQIEEFNQTPSEMPQIPSNLEEIITTQIEINGFNAIKRLFKRNDLDRDRLQMKDTIDYCGINIDGDEAKTLIKLYFNDENNLIFSLVLSNGEESQFPINSIRGISSKKELIIARAKELMEQPDNPNSQPSHNPISSADYDYSINHPFPSDKTIEELLEKGYIGVDYELVIDNAFVVAANHKFKEQIKWVRTQPDQDGDVALMTNDTQAFDQLLDFMLDKFGWCPQVYSNQTPQEIYIFTPKNEQEEQAIYLATVGDFGWKGSLYSLEYNEAYRDKSCLIFATQPKDSQKQEWLLVQVNTKKKQISWSVHDESLEKVYYLWAESIKIPEPKFKPTADELIDAIKSKFHTV
ncbi:protein kinase [Crocosphaera sp. UHCC 0190]|uniref:protein kinase domain-containing protein n=1 Tax=Crocosphaera sp. UHCC 0190 TaxID=3110246 RepID=UPI002B213317|nr:protein kinase [Crocosphaera sp. UHCC 0190]MEA5510529.1 protein kinase [Crocosphaera sp. UHCC 0190]